MKIKINRLGMTIFAIVFMVLMTASPILGQTAPEYKVKVGDTKDYEITATSTDESPVELDDGTTQNISLKVGDTITVEVTKASTTNVSVKFKYGDKTSKEQYSDYYIYPVGDSAYFTALATASTNAALNSTGTYEGGFFTSESDIWFSFLGTESRTQTKVKYSTETGWLEEYSIKSTLNGEVQAEYAMKAKSGSAPGFELISVLPVFALLSVVYIYKKKE